MTLRIHTGSPDTRSREKNESHYTSTPDLRGMPTLGLASLLGELRERRLGMPALPARARPRLRALKTKPSLD